MALNYSVSLRPNPLDKDAAPKAYATAQINGELTLKQLSKRVSSQTTVSRADVVAVLTAPWTICWKPSPKANKWTLANWASSVSR